MEYLLDTHALLWWFSNPRLLSEESRNIIHDTRNLIFVSSVSTWEIVIKRSLGKLKVPNRIFELIQEEHFYELSISIAHTKALATLPDHHHDPFDRLLIAQAITEDFTLITRDKVMKKYALSIVEA